MKKKVWTVCIIICVFAAVYAAVSIWISCNYLVVRNFRQESAEISGEIRFVVLSDLHDHQFGKNNEELIEKVSQQHPDFILMDGDMLNDTSSDAEVVCSLIRGLREKAPVFAALGNHEIEYMQSHSELISDFEAAGAVVLEEAYTDMEIRGTKIRLGGMYEYAFYREGMNQKTRQFLEDFQDTENVKIMMSHRPDSFIFGDAPENWDIDLVVSGHNHGGQVVVPFAGGVFGGDQGWFPKYVHGTEQAGNYYVFETSGLGSNRQILPRFNNPPEIAVITYGNVA